MKYLTRQFMGCFGKTTHMQKFKIVYYFGVNKIEITLNKDGYIRFAFWDVLTVSNIIFMVCWGSERGEKRWF